MSEVLDLAIIGAGPGGYVCAIRAAQLGLKTALIEKGPTLGGTCVNVGCIPSKALLDSSEKYYLAREGLGAHGIKATGVELDLAALMARKEKIVKELTDGLNFLMNKNKVQVVRGHGRLTGAKSPFVIDVDGQTIAARNCVIASGSSVIELPFLPVDGKRVITSDQAIALTAVPEHLVVIGGGVIGLELGSVWKRLGAKVTIIEVLPDILMMIDKQSRELSRRILSKQGLEFLLEHKVTAAEQAGSLLKVTIENREGKKEVLSCSHLLVAAGRKPCTENLGLKEAGIALTDRGRISVDKKLQTTVPGIYAIGDVIDGPMLAHKAEEEGVMVAEIIAGKHGHVNYNAIPGVVYTWPEIAWVGQMEDELVSQKIPYRTGKFLFRPNGRAKAMQESEGQVRIFAHAQTDQILGAVIIGPTASELIGEITLGMEFSASAEDIARTCHAHPTLSEVLREAALDVDKRAIHS
ncbi:MAG: dihydrolipoyl dehydrogenase [Spirochaetales bacterium]|nr:dihydrolipoyl dehydrogenase [Spirochaetales bacterium]